MSCFKAYDIRGRLGSELNEDVAYRVGRAYAQVIKPKTVAVGGDFRLSSESLKQALTNGLIDSGVNVIDLGMTGTEEIYYAAQYLDVEGGIEVTASHNPIDYNGMKLVAKHAVPIGADTGLREIQKLTENDDFSSISDVKGVVTKQSIVEPFVDHLIGYLDINELKPLKLVVNAGNGAAGHVIDSIEKRFEKLCAPIEFIKIHHEADGSFPNGIPNPLLPENRESTSQAVRDHNADFGVAWDGDFDRCFLFDEKGDFIEGYYIVGLLAEAFLKKSPGEKIIHDPRLTWNTIDMIEMNKGIAVQSKTGHAYIKEKMREVDAIYGGEMSAHHYFRDFSYCDSGMIPWLLVSELVCRSGKTLSQFVKERMSAYPCTGEINYKVTNTKLVISRVRIALEDQAIKIDLTDGLSLEFSDWRLNLRASNTEPLLRLNIETRGDINLMEECLKQVENINKGNGLNVA